MKKTYTVTGMTCGGCKVSVEKALNSLKNIKNARVNMESSEVEIETDKTISIEKLQNALSAKYTISQTKVEVKEKSEIQQLFPLFLIFGYIIIAGILLNYKSWNANSFMLDFMGLFYVVFSFFKFLDLKGFPKSFRMYDPLAKAIPVYSWVYPFIEAALGVMFLMRIEISIALIITLIILGVTTIGVTKSLLDKKAIKCACLGTALKLPMTKATFIENSIMIVMAVYMLIKIYG